MHAPRRALADKFATVVCGEGRCARRSRPRGLPDRAAGARDRAARCGGDRDSPGGVAAARAAEVPVVVTRSAYFGDAAIDGAVAIGRACTSEAAGGCAAPRSGRRRARRTGRPAGWCALGDTVSSSAALGASRPSSSIRGADGRQAARRRGFVGRIVDAELRALGRRGAAEARPGVSSKPPGAAACTQCRTKSSASRPSWRSRCNTIARAPRRARQSGREFDQAAERKLVRDDLACQAAERGAGGDQALDRSGAAQLVVHVQADRGARAASGRPPCAFPIPVRAASRSPRSARADAGVGRATGPARRRRPARLRAGAAPPAAGASACPRKPTSASNPATAATTSRVLPISRRTGLPGACASTCASSAGAAGTLADREALPPDAAARRAFRRTGARGRSPGRTARSPGAAGRGPAR